jgi:hypothetical protein
MTTDDDRPLNDDGFPNCDICGETEGPTGPNHVACFQLNTPTPTRSERQIIGDLLWPAGRLLRHGGTAAPRGYGERP